MSDVQASFSLELPPPRSITTIRHLSNEMLQLVLANLPVAPDLLHHRTVCHLWNDVIESICTQQRSLMLGEYQYNLKVEEYSLYLFEPAKFVKIPTSKVKFGSISGLSTLFAFLHRLFPNVEQWIGNFDFDSDGHLIVQLLEQLVRLWPNTQALMVSGDDFRGYSDETQHRFLNHIGGLTKLKWLVMDNLLAQFPPANIKVMQQLEYISYADTFRDDKLPKMKAIELGPNCTGLNLCIYSVDDYLKISSLRDLFDLNNIFTGPKSYPNITRLGLSSIDVEKAIGVVRLVADTFPSLQLLRLEFEGASLFDDWTFEQLARLRSLSTLSLKNVDFIERFCDTFTGGISLPTVRTLYVESVLVQARDPLSMRLPKADNMARALSILLPHLELVHITERDGSGSSIEDFNQTLVDFFNRKSMFPNLKHCQLTKY